MLNDKKTGLKGRRIKKRSILPMIINYQKLEMFKWKILLTSLPILFSVFLYGQDNADSSHFNKLISTVSGDLNTDGLPDSVVVLQDTLDETGPYRLQVFLSGLNGETQLYVQSDSAIEAQNPNGRSGFSNGTNFSGLSIDSGKLTLETELIRGHYSYTFRFQHGNFELIGFREVNSDGDGKINSCYHNLETGLRVEKTERYDSNKLMHKTQRIVRVKKLPTLQRFTPFSTDWY